MKNNEKPINCNSVTQHRADGTSCLKHRRHSTWQTVLKIPCPEINVNTAFVLPSKNMRNLAVYSYLLV